MALPAAEAELSEEQVLRYLANLQPDQAAALLAKSAQKTQKPDSLLAGPVEDAQDGLDRDRTESAKEAMRAIAAGNFAVAQERGAKADLCCLGEDGWGFLHWVVHVAGAAGAASMQKEEHAVGCQCCHTSPAHKRGPAFALLQNLLSSEEGRSAVDFPTSQGATPLMFAADAGDEETCAELLRARADVSLKDCDGDTAEAWALAKSHRNLATLLHS
ncbi:pgl [Symbiodinium sp. CCMP2592]|nr:pgl [Symbiodinium sp. CCMP2592]